MPHMKTFPRPTESNDQENKPGHRGGLLLMLAVYSNPRWLSVVRGAVERLTETLGFPAVQCRSITRAVDEALTNIVRHSYGNRPGQPITMYFRRARRHRQWEEIESGLEILLCDRGQAVDPSKFRGRPLEEIRPGGLGLYFIRQAMDIVEFSRKSGTNRLRLVRDLARPRNDV
jgi:anti-sigma regulatory factor (Ser/Thr protein kinase)